MTSISVTIPAYNEVETLAAVVDEAVAAARAVTDDYEVLVVDDGSTDGTGALADRIAEDHRGEVRVLHHGANRGFSGAMRSCMENAAKDYVFLVPADGQADMAELKRFVDLVPEKDLIFSYRAAREDPLFRKVSSWLWFTMLRLMFGVRVPEFSSTFLFRRETLRALRVDVREDASNFLPVLFIKATAAGVPVGVLGTVQLERRGGVAKGADVANTLRTLREDVRLFWEIRVRGRR